MHIVALPTQQRPTPTFLAAEGPSAGRGVTDLPRILIVEDEYLVAVELETALIDAGFAIVGSARTANEALQLAEVERPALIVMDVRLAGRRDGIDAAVSIYRSTGIRCIFTTAYGWQQVRDRAEAADPLGWLAKPYQSDALVRLVREALKRLQQ